MIYIHRVKTDRKIDAYKFGWVGVRKKIEEVENNIRKSILQLLNIGMHINTRI